MNTKPPILHVTEIAQSNSTGSFFHIDRRIWRRLCDEKNIHMASAYLVLAQGTGANNRTTFWSAKSIEKNTGLHSTRAKIALGLLVGRGYLQLGENSTRKHPQYELLTFEAQLRYFRSEFEHESGLELFAVCKKLRCNAKLSKSDRKTADSFVAEGLMWKVGPSFCLEPPVGNCAENLIWLPNSIVTGTSEGERSPVRRLRSRGDLNALRLFVDLYRAQNLSAEGGISRKVLRVVYERKRYGQRGRHIVWGFSIVNKIAYCDQTTEFFWEEEETILWETIDALEGMGLLTMVPHLVETSEQDCEPIHAFGWIGAGEVLEQQLGKAADAAGKHMLGSMAFTADNPMPGFTPDGTMLPAQGFQVEMLAPVYDTMPDVQMVGVYRLRYRPRTRLTADWFRELNERGGQWLETYRELGPVDYSAIWKSEESLAG